MQPLPVISQQTKPVSIPLTVEWVIPRIAKKVEGLNKYYIKRHRHAIKKYKTGKGPLPSVPEDLVQAGEFFLYPEEPKFGPVVEPQEFLELLVEGGDFTAESLLLTYILLERFLGSTRLSGLVHFYHLLGIAALTAHKFLEETGFWYFPEFSKLSGLEASDLPVMEKLFLEGFEHKLYVSSSEWEFYLTALGNQE